ncbi:MAG TPA: hypothetical protein VHO68_11190 [Bacteroidales bacterium]|nr:hypothetical protein [Bacteroidales bacterium]
MYRKFLIPALMFLLFSCEKISDTGILKFYGDVYEDAGYSLAKTDKGYLIAGQYTSISRNEGKISGSSRKMALIRTGINGIETRLDTLGGKNEASAAKVISLEDGTSLVAGTIKNTATGQDIYIARFTADGEGFTEKIFRWPDNQYSTDIIKTSSGFLLLGTTDREYGTTGNKKGKKDFLLLGLNNMLDSVRSTQWGFDKNDEGAALKQEKEGEYVVVGTTEFDAAGLKDIYIFKVRSDLSTISSRLIEGDGTEMAADFEIVSDGYIIAGNSSMGGTQAAHIWKVPLSYLIPGNSGGSKTTEDHAIVLEPNEDNPRPFIVNAMCRYKTSSFILAGQYGNASGGDMLIFAVDANGYPDYGRIRKAGGTGSQAAYDVITDGDDIIATGKNSYENNSMITLMKFRF